MNPREGLPLSPNWHIDCRLVAELPEESVVGVRFITYAASCVAATIAVIITGFLAYSDFSVRHRIENGNEQNEEDQMSLMGVKIQQHYYEIETKKIEGAYAAIANPLFLSGFITELGKRLPGHVGVDSIDLNEGTIVVRGGLHESSDRASMMLGAFVESLRNDKAVGPYFKSINLTGAERSSQDEQLMDYEITFKEKPRSP